MSALDVIPGFGFVKRFYRDFRWTWTTATAGAVAAERWRRP